MTSQRSYDVDNDFETLPNKYKRLEKLLKKIIRKLK